MKIHLIFILILLITSCGLHGDALDIVVENKTDFTVKEVKVYAVSYKDGALELGEIMPGKRATGYLNMSEVPSSDGVTILHYRNDKDEEVIQGGAYYTNGSPLSRRETFVILPDTIIHTTSNFGRTFKGK